MMLSKFQSKFGLGELVEFQGDNKEGFNEYGHVVSIEFYKSDAVNYAASYTVELVNTRVIVRSIQESKIIKAHTVRG